MKKLIAVGCFLVGAFGLANVQAAIPSILGDSFELSGTIDGLSVAAGTMGVAGAAGDDIMATVGDFEIYLDWVDGDSFNVQLVSLSGASSINGGADFTLSDLNFKFGAIPANITGATFNPNANGYTGYFYDPVNNDTAPPRPSDPIVSWTSDSVRLQYGSDWNSLTIGDQIRLRFDVVAVPEPRAYGLASALVLGVIAWFRVAARRSQRMP